MINQQNIMEVFKNSLPVTTLELIGSDIYPSEMQKEVKIQPLSLQQEKSILTQDYQFDNYGIIIDLVKAGIQSAIDVEQLYLFDVEYIFNALRISTHGSHLILDSKCPSCGQTSSSNVDLSVVEINKPKTLEDISVPININNIKFLIRYPIVKHYLDVVKIIYDPSFPNDVRQFVKNNKLANDKQISQIDDDTIRDMSTIITHIYSMQDEEITVKDDIVYLCAFLLLLPESNLLEFVPKMQNMIKPFELKPEVICPACKTKYNIDVVDLGVDYFFPSRT